MKNAAAAFGFLILGLQLTGSGCSSAPTGDTPHYDDHHVHSSVGVGVGVHTGYPYGYPYPVDSRELDRSQITDTEVARAKAAKTYRSTTPRTPRTGGARMGGGRRR